MDFEGLGNREMRRHFVALHPPIGDMSVKDAATSMNCVLFVGSEPACVAGECSAPEGGADDGLHVTTFDRYFECAGQASALAMSMMTGVYPSVHGVGRGVAEHRFVGPTLPALLQRCGVDCVAVTPPGVLGSSGSGSLITITEGTSAEALDSWLAARGDPKRPFFSFVWGRWAGDRSEALAGIVDVLARRSLLLGTAVIAVASLAPGDSAFQDLAPPALPLRISSRREMDERADRARIAGTVDLFPTVLDLIGRLETSVPGVQGSSLVGSRGSPPGGGSRAVFSERVDERFGVRSRAVRGNRSWYADFCTDRRFVRRLFHFGPAILSPGPAWRRRLLLEMLFRGAAERDAGAAEPSGVGEARSWGRCEIARWSADCRARAAEIRRQGETGQEAVLRSRLRGMGYLR